MLDSVSPRSLPCWQSPALYGERSLSGLRAEGRDVWLDLIGGSQATNLADFHREAERLGVTDRVRFVDEVPNSELPGRLAEADLFVLPSYSEGLPVSPLEALACGLPLVTTRCGGPEEVVDDWHSPPGKVAFWCR